MPIRTKALTNSSEAIVSEQLSLGLEGSSWTVAPHVPVRDVIAIEDEALTEYELRLRQFGHFDFSVFATRQFNSPPAFVVEFDGPRHDEPEQVRRDLAKNRLCKGANLPLLRLSDADLAPLEKRTVVAWIAERFAAHQREMPALERWCRQQLEQLSGVELELAIESGNYDSGVLFDLDHPFPENRVIAERLRRRFA